MLNYAVEQALLRCMMKKTVLSWTVVDQWHILPNNLGAVQVEGSVYFIMNNFPVDRSGIRIPPGEVYPVSLNEREDSRKGGKKCNIGCVRVNKENLASERLNLRLRL